LSDATSRENASLRKEIAQSGEEHPDNKQDKTVEDVMGIIRQNLHIRNMQTQKMSLRLWNKWLSRLMFSSL
jgi:hypothetical protein